MQNTPGAITDPFGAASAQPLDLVLLYDDTSTVHRGLPTDTLPDADTGTMAPMVEALESLGHRVRAFGVTYDNLGVLDEFEAEHVLQIADGSGYDGHPGVEIPIALERRGLGFSGAGSIFYAATVDKWAMKARLAAARVPVPCGAVVPHPDTPFPSALMFPLIVKPRDAYGSLGIDERSVVNTPAEAREAIARLTTTYAMDALVEHYIPGREVTVGIIGAGRRAWALPPMEIVFGKAYKGLPKIKTFATKFDVHSPLYSGFECVCPAPLPPTVLRQVEQVALRAYRAVGGDGYGRVDMRLGPDGTPYVLEVNANCSLDYSPDPRDCATMPLIAQSLGWDYPQLLHRLIGAGLLRPRWEMQPMLAPRWCNNRTSIHAATDLSEGDVVRTVGPVYRAPAADSSRGTMLTAEGRPVFVEPHLRHLAHDEDPSLVIERVDGSLCLTATRAVRAGEELTVDRTRPLDLSWVRHCPTAHGRRLTSRTTPVAAPPVSIDGAAVPGSVVGI